MKYFSVQELCNSNTAILQKINNKPTQDIELNLIDLITNCLDPLREAYGKPIRVSSGYRCAELNKAIGGTKNSQHLKGQAADLHGKNPEENKKIFEAAKKLKLGFDQLIDEKNFSWVHISWKKEGNRNQILKL